MWLSEDSKADAHGHNAPFEIGIGPRLALPIVTSRAVRATPNVSRDDGTFGAMRFDVLVPVPEVPSGWALAAGLSGLTLLMRRRRRAGQA